MSVPPRVSTVRFWRTIASASEQRTSFDGMPLLIRLTMSVSAKTPHLAATWWSLLSSKWRLVTSSGGAFTLRKHLSMVAPVPRRALVVHRGDRRSSRRVFSSVLNMMIFASCPPSSMTLPTSGCRCSTASVTALTSWTNLPPVGAQSGAGARAGEEHPPVAGGVIREGREDRLEHREHVLGLLRVVPLVVAPEDLLRRRVDDDGLHRRAPDVHPNRELRSCFARHPLLVRVQPGRLHDCPAR